MSAKRTCLYGMMKACLYYHALNSAPPRVNMLNLNLLCAIYINFELVCCFRNLNFGFTYVCVAIMYDLHMFWGYMYGLYLAARCPCWYLIWLDIWFEIVLLLHINSGADTIATLSKYENIKKSNLCIDILFWDNFSTNAVNPRKMPLTLIMSRIKQ